DLRDQFTTASRLVVRIFASNCRSGKLIGVVPYFSRSKGIVRYALHCARRTSTVSSCAFREHKWHPGDPLRSIPFERSLLPGIPKSGQQNYEKHEHFDESQQAK